MVGWPWVNMALWSVSAAIFTFFFPNSTEVESRKHPIFWSVFQPIAVWNTSKSRSLVESLSPGFPRNVERPEWQGTRARVITQHTWCIVIVAEGAHKAFLKSISKTLWAPSYLRQRGDLRLYFWAHGSVPTPRPPHPFSRPAGQYYCNSQFVQGSWTVTHGGFHLVFMIFLGLQHLLCDHWHWFFDKNYCETTTTRRTDDLVWLDDLDISGKICTV